MREFERSVPSLLTLVLYAGEEHNLGMTGVAALPVRGDVFLDGRAEGRALRLSWHHDGELVVLSIWREHRCVTTFQLTSEDVPALIESLVDGLAEGYRGRDIHPPHAV